ncbi:MAG: 3-dehydroquinate synthase [Candidatus Cloacimonetes bacterium]|nr:3-dehydroquinate synthase [Candidatus Cloacimonadota bacterium]
MKFSLADKQTEIKFVSFRELTVWCQKGCFYIIDANIDREYPEICGNLNHKYLFAALEENKTLVKAEDIISCLLLNGANRESHLIAIGGGITCDLAGWVAANYMRGCQLSFIPTSLIAMIDAALGGKTALNFQGSKNLIGSFYPASQVLIATDFIKSLSSKMLLAGKAELVKTALLQKGELLPLLRQDNWIEPETLLEIIMNAVNFKMTICTLDPYDKKQRRLLNLGHTFAHVIESALNYQVEHGRAVAIGIAAAANLSFIRNMIDIKRYDNILQLLQDSFPQNYFFVDSREFAVIEKKGQEFFLHDKKAGKTSRVVLFNGINDVIITEAVSWQEILASINTYENKGGFNA